MPIHVSAAVNQKGSLAKSSSAGRMIIQTMVVSERMIITNHWLYRRGWLYKPLVVSESMIIQTMVVSERMIIQTVVVNMDVIVNRFYFCTVSNTKCVVMEIMGITLGYVYKRLTMGIKLGYVYKRFDSHSNFLCSCF